MSDSEDQRPYLGHNQKLSENFFSDNPFKFENRSSRSVSERSQNEIIVETQIISDAINEEKYRVMKIEMPQSSKSNQSRQIQEQKEIPNTLIQNHNYEVRSMEQIHQSSDSDNQKYETPKKGSQTNIYVPMQIPYIDKRNQTEASTKKIEDQQIVQEIPIDEKVMSRKRQKIFQKYRTPNRKTLNKSNILDSFRKDNSEFEAQTKVLNKVNFEKKRQNQSALKTWNYDRINKIDFHREIVQEISRSVDKLMKESLANLEMYRTFFQQRVQQQERYVAEKVTNTSNALNNNQTATNIYMNCSSMLNFLAKKESEQKNRIKQFVFLLKNNILKGIYDSYMNNVNKELLSLRERLSGVKQALKKADEDVCRQLIELQKNFSDCSDNVAADQNDDFYLRQISFLRQCQAETNLQLKLGRLCYDYFKAAIEEEKKRSLIIKESLFTYIRCCKQYYKKAGRQESINFSNESLTLQQLGKNQQDNLIEELFSLQQMLNGKKFKQLNEYFIVKAIKELKKQESQVSDTDSLRSKGEDYISQNQLKMFLTQLEFQQFDRRLLIVRKFQITVCKENRWIPGEIIITIDKHIHIFVYASLEMGGVVYGTQCYAKPQLSLRISQLQTTLLTKEQEVTDDLEVKISFRGAKKVLQFLRGEGSQNQEIVRFSREQELLQFQDYLQQLSR